MVQAVENVMAVKKCRLARQDCLGCFHFDGLYHIEVLVFGVGQRHFANCEY